MSVDARFIWPLGQLYGPLAKNQADGMEPIVTAFLEGALPPMS